MNGKFHFSFFHWLPRHRFFQHDNFPIAALPFLPRICPHSPGIPVRDHITLHQAAPAPRVELGGYPGSMYPAFLRLTPSGGTGCWIRNGPVEVVQTLKCKTYVNLDYM